MNLRVTGIGPIQRPELTELAPAGGADSGRGAPSRRCCLPGRRTRAAAWRPARPEGATGSGRSCSAVPRPASPPRCTGGRTSGRRRGRGPGGDRGVRRDGAGASRLRGPGRRVRQPARRGGGGARMTARTLTDSDGGGGPGAAGDRRGHPGVDREGGRDGDRAHVAVADDPRRARLPGRHPRPAAAQADRPVVQRARAPDRARLPAGDDAARGRVLPQRRLPVRGRHRAPARPVRHGAGVP